VAKILVADDNSNIQKMVGLALKDQGIDVVAVGNGEAAVRKISDVKPDLVLADVFMPVRNGYEVCRYVKEDAALSHIPVILLVGAFDPLDEQEAQRVGADGVLKKPFVPPDPLISMVKSALTRAGVSLGPAAPPEKPAAPTRSTADILSGNVGSKIAALSPDRVPEVAPEPVEEFAPPREQVKIAAGQEPVAFGSLLNTQEEEDAAVFSSSKPMIEISKPKEWDEETQDVPEEEEEEESASRGAWRAGGMNDELERAAESAESVPDWRDQAFHGNSPTNSNGSTPWTPTHEKSDFAEAAETKAVVATTTIDAQPVTAPTAVPFSGDAWAAAMAAGVEEKLAQQQADGAVLKPEAAVEPPAASPAELPGAMAASPNTVLASPAPAVDEGKAAEPANWAPVPESSWEAEAKRASMLAATWDAPVAEPEATPAPVSPDETQEISAYAAEHPEMHAASHVEEAPSSYSGHFEPAEVATPAEPPATIDTSAEVAVEPTPPSQWGETLEVMKVETPVETIETPVERPSATNAQPDMDELVARVLGKMNPEVLQRVTREILKPVIEAIVRDELSSKKS
jgi:CheY-like chemotaxis protein